MLKLLLSNGERTQEGAVSSHVNLRQEKEFNPLQEFLAELLDLPGIDKRLAGGARLAWKPNQGG